MHELTSNADFASHLRDAPLAAVYFSGPDCGVCRVLEPRLAALLEAEFPALATARVDCRRLPELAAAQSVFAIPTLLIYIDGRETLRYARAFSPAQVRDDLQRPYRLFLD